MARKRRNATNARTKPRPGQVLARLQAGDAAEVLRTLLERHPDLTAEAERLAKSAVTGVDVEAIAEDVEQAVLGLDLDDLNARAGGSAGATSSPRTPHGSGWKRRSGPTWTR